MSNIPKVEATPNAIIAPPDPGAFENTQLDLFRPFLCHGPIENDLLSNTIDLWDSIPPFFGVAAGDGQGAQGTRPHPVAEGRLPLQGNALQADRLLALP